MFICKYLYIKFDVTTIPSFHIRKTHNIHKHIRSVKTHFLIEDNQNGGVNIQHDLLNTDFTATRCSECAVADTVHRKKGCSFTSINGY